MQQIGLRFEVLDVDVDESQHAGEPPAELVERLARAKAEVGLASVADGIDSARVVGADTVVVLDGMTLGKPRDVDQARAMLGALAGHEHEVMSGVALATVAGTSSALSVSRVHMRHIEPAEIDAYVATVEPHDKAGAYAIQGRAAAFVTHIEGSYSGIVGLPLAVLDALLRGAPPRR